MSLRDRERAWIFAHKLLSIVKVIPALEGRDLLVVSTEQICIAMGAPERAPLEAVQRFVFDVIAFMKEYGLYIACGCGYLSLMVCPAERHESIIIHRDTTAFTPESIDGYFARHVLAAGAAETCGVEEICDSKRS